MKKRSGRPTNSVISRRVTVWDSTDAVPFGHPEVHEHDVGPLAARNGHRLAPIRRLACDREVVLVLKQP